MLRIIKSGDTNAEYIFDLHILHKNYVRRIYMKKQNILLIFLIVCVFISSSHMVSSAEEPYRILYQSEEITDTTRLIEMYCWKRKSALFPTTGISATEMVGKQTEKNNASICVEQVLECREYKDGKREYEVAVMQLAAYENGKALSVETTVDTLNRSYSNNLLYVTMSGKIVYYIENSDYYVQLLSVSSVVNNKSVADSVSLKLAFTIAAGFGGEGEWNDSTSVFPAVQGETYVLYNSKGAPPVAVTRYQNVMEFGCYVFLNGREVQEIKYNTAQIREYIRGKVF